MTAGRFAREWWGNVSLVTTLPLAETTVEHEHELHLVLVDYDDAGRAVREYECTSCGTVWFD